MGDNVGAEPGFARTTVAAATQWHRRVARRQETSAVARACARPDQHRRTGGIAPSR